jgi:hypothetical protein
MGTTEGYEQVRRVNYRLRGPLRYTLKGMNGNALRIFEILSESKLFKISNNHKYKMFKKFNLTDKLLFIAAILSLVFSEILFFQGHENQAIFIGLWVPSILCFGVYLKLISKND